MFKIHQKTQIKMVKSVDIIWHWLLLDLGLVFLSVHHLAQWYFNSLVLKFHFTFLPESVLLMELFNCWPIRYALSYYFEHVEKLNMNRGVSDILAVHFGILWNVFLSHIKPIQQHPWRNKKVRHCLSCLQTHISCSLLLQWLLQIFVLHFLRQVCIWKSEVHSN